MGGRIDIEREDVIRWMKTDYFSVCCDLADLNDLWVKDLINSIRHINPRIRHKVTLKSIELLKAIFRMQAARSDEPYFGGVISPVEESVNHIRLEGGNIGTRPVNRSKWGESFGSSDEDISDLLYIYNEDEEVSDID